MAWWQYARVTQLSILLAATTALPLPAQGDSATPAMAGLSSNGRTGSRPYVTAGTRTYLIGTQDGNFPDMGEHMPGEMGGVWLHPIKLVDGFQATISEANGPEGGAVDGCRLHYLPLREPVRLRPAVGQPRDRALPVQSGRTGGVRRPVRAPKHGGRAQTLTFDSR